jgi:signal transduction histidine kinase
VIEGYLIVTVSDNGKGFDQERTRPRGLTGFGLKNMAERASAIQADLKFEQVPDSGTRITVTKKIGPE